MYLRIAMAAFNSPLFNKETADRREPYFVADDAVMDNNHFYLPQHYQETLKSMLVPHGMIVDRVEKLAADIATDYEGHTIHMLCVLKGKLHFALFDHGSTLYILSSYRVCYFRWLDVLR